MNVPTTQRLLLFPCPLNKIIHMVAIMPNIALWGTMKPKQTKNQNGISVVGFFWVSPPSLKS